MRTSTTQKHCGSTFFGFVQRIKMQYARVRQLSPPEEQGAWQGSTADVEGLTDKKSRQRRYKASL